MAVPAGLTQSLLLETRERQPRCFDPLCLAIVNVSVSGKNPNARATCAGSACCAPLELPSTMAHSFDHVVSLVEERRRTKIFWEAQDERGRSAKTFRE